MTALKQIKFLNSVRCGQDEKFFFQEDTHELTVGDNLVVEIKHKRHGTTVYSSLMNAVWWTKVADKTTPEKPEQQRQRK